MPLSTELRLVLEDRLRQTEEFTWLEQCSAPAPIALIFQYIESSIEHKRQKNPGSNLPKSFSFFETQMDYKKFFQPGTCTLTFPPDVLEDQEEKPYPYYHSITGLTICLLDWKWSHPKVSLNCPTCGNESLCHDRTNFSKNKKIVPVWQANGTVMWTSVMVYTCLTCRARINANNAKLLVSLPAHIRNAYPVDPRYAGQTGFHLHYSATDELDAVMKTYGNGDFFSKKLYQSSGLQYSRHLESYLSQSPTEKFPTYTEWTGQNYPPSGSSIQSHYLAAEESDCTPYSISNLNRYRRELQSVSTSKAVAINWTFQVTKNYLLPGSKACFTMCTETGEIACLAIVDSTKTSQISHLLQMLVQKRPNFRPKWIYTDTWPHSIKFWENIFGQRVVGRLGFFHLIKRITDTLNSHCDLYWKGLVALKCALYRYHDEDERQLISALKDGSFSRTNKKFTDNDIVSIRESKQWKQKYDRYLRKVFYPTETMQHNLIQGRQLFSRDTEKSAVEQTKKVEFVRDPPEFSVYHEILQGPEPLIDWLKKSPSAQNPHLKSSMNL